MRKKNTRDQFVNIPISTHQLLKLSPEIKCNNKSPSVQFKYKYRSAFNAKIEARAKSEIESCLKVDQPSNSNPLEFFQTLEDHQNSEFSTKRPIYQIHNSRMTEDLTNPFNVCKIIYDISDKRKNKEIETLNDYYKNNLK